MPEGTASAPARAGRILHDIGAIGASAWNRCANPADAEYNPFLDHRFLHALEASGSVCAQTGWQPFHVVLAPAEGGVDDAVGVVPMYVKGHSRGEFVFDGAWAEAFHRAGGRYYPKLQASVPFTPATGRRLLVAQGQPEGEVERQLLGVAIEVARRTNVSSLHLTFLPESQWRHAAAAGCLPRMDTQFHWRNDGYDTFDDFAAALAAKKRKNIRRERREALADGIDIEWLSGNITEAQWDAFHACYLDTSRRKWGSAYLTREFFSRVGEAMGDRVLLVMCKRAGRYIAGAINFIGGDTLYGRNWGCLEDHRFLHFEACYYQAIDFAIAHGLKRVEAGAQGGHKIARGYLPCPTYSAHWIRDPALRDAVQRYLREEREYVRHDMDTVAEHHSPFRRDAAGRRPDAGGVDVSRYRLDGEDVAINGE